MLDRLKMEYPGSKAAIFSYIIKARFLSNEQQTVEAQQELIELADGFPGKRIRADGALRSGDQCRETPGQDAFLTEANQLLERLAREYPDDNFLFYARSEAGGPAQETQPVQRGAADLRIPGEQLPGPSRPTGGPVIAGRLSDGADRDGSAEVRSRHFAVGATRRSAQCAGRPAGGGRGQARAGLGGPWRPLPRKGNPLVGRDPVPAR